MKQRQTNRQQFSACGACRARRVYCDLKDICAEALSANIPPVCSSCRDRDFICRYEFDTAKAAKLLRRGRRVREVEKLYGRTTVSSPSSPQQESQSDFPIVLQGQVQSQDPSNTPTPAPPQSVVPPLHPSFFDSEFFRMFHIQHPILDPHEFSSRYKKYYNVTNSSPTSSPTTPTESLGPAGHLISKLLVIWAYSFGLDETGSRPITDEGREERRTKCNSMLQEVIGLMDAYGILRKSSYDGIRALLLLVALDQDMIISTSQVIHSNIMSHVSILCILTTTGANFNGDGGAYGDALVRSLIFWYAHIREGTSIGLRGGRLFLTEDDNAQFMYNIPDPVRSTTSALVQRYNMAHTFSQIPLQISIICRRIHACLKVVDIDERAMTEIAADLEKCWLALDQFRNEMVSSSSSASPEVDQFASSWQIFLFQCYQEIQSAISQRLASISPSMSASTSQSNRESLTRLQSYIHQRAYYTLAKHLLPLMARLNKTTNFFAYDAGHAKGGVLAAADLIARNEDMAFTDDDFGTVLEALRRMRWIYNMGTEEANLRATWNDRKGISGMSLSTTSQPFWSSSSPPLAIGTRDPNLPQLSPSSSVMPSRNSSQLIPSPPPSMTTTTTTTGSRSGLNLNLDGGNLNAQRYQQQRIMYQQRSMEGYGGSATSSLSSETGSTGETPPNLIFNGPLPGGHHAHQYYAPPSGSPPTSASPSLAFPPPPPPLPQASGYPGTSNSNFVSLPSPISSEFSGFSSLPGHSQAFYSTLASPTTVPTMEDFIYGPPNQTHGAGSSNY